MSKARQSMRYAVLFAAVALALPSFVLAQDAVDATAVEQPAVEQPAEDPRPGRGEVVPKLPLRDPAALGQVDCSGPATRSPDPDGRSER